MIESVIFDNLDRTNDTAPDFVDFRGYLFKKLLHNTFYNDILFSVGGNMTEEDKEDCAEYIDEVRCCNVCNGIGGHEFGCPEATE